jgi:hypothetical protein
VFTWSNSDIPGPRICRPAAAVPDCDGERVVSARSTANRTEARHCVTTAEEGRPGSLTTSASISYCRDAILHTESNTIETAMLRVWSDIDR